VGASVIGQVCEVRKAIAVLQQGIAIRLENAWLVPHKVVRENEV